MSGKPPTGGFRWSLRLFFAEVLKGERRFLDLGAQQLNGLLQVVALCACHAHQISLYCRRQLERLGRLDLILNLFGQIPVNAAFHGERLAQRVAASLLRGLAFIEKADIHAALGELADQHIAHLLELEVGIGYERELEILLFDCRGSAAEVKAVADFLLGLGNGIVEFDRIGFENNVKTGHGMTPLWLYAHCKTVLAGDRRQVRPYNLWHLQNHMRPASPVRSEAIQMMIRQNVELAPYTTFGVPAKARFFAEPESLDELSAILNDPATASVPRLVLGGGSNILFTQDFDGLVIRPRMREIELEDENDEFRFVRVGAGADWSETVADFVARDWPGLENLSLVPGSVGGAAVQNIGAYGLEVAERIVEIQCLDPDSGKVVELGVDECDYAYRTSAFKREKKSLIVLSVLFALPKRFEPRVSYKELAAAFGDRQPRSAAEVAEAVIAIRKRKLPDPRELGSAGSFFKNPVVTRVKMNFLLDDDPRLVAYPLAGGRAKLAAGWLIEAVGMKGMREGNAGVYPKNALVLVNCGGATGAEVLALAQKIQSAVKKRFGVQLEPEPVIV